MELIKIEGLASLTEAAALQIVLAAIESGEKDPLLFDAEFKTMADIATHIRKNPTFKDAVMTEFEKHTSKSTLEQYGFKFTKKATKEWDYSECNDPELRMLKEKYEEKINEAKVYKSRIEFRENQLQLMAVANRDRISRISAIDDNTGEVLTLPTFTTKTSYSTSKIK